ncbi:hypothetical protein CLOHAE12215_00021 [Clostridium haemolyticum]|uniref:ABC-2 transporter permease n=1 Tax=Clostridium haemolyticum TaxID=84025 RepID=UPI001C3BF930|nr:ABC-2 transporter permease [Clostridium haemolyticum]CAG7838687.1 hypothetical protein CLOHAE12215_00021 [Clostridium haemolyticum]
MLLNLVKKDILLVKKYLPLMMILPFAIPVLVMVQVPQLLGLSAFIVSAIFSVFMLYQYVLMAEMKYPKAEALLCSTPYSRSIIVKARYTFLLLIFAYCCGAYNILALIFSKIKYLTLYNYIIALLILVILFGVYMPIQYKLGFEKTKYFFMILILGTPLVIPLLIRAHIKFQFTGLFKLSMFFHYLILIVFIMAILFTSINISIKVYSKKELK